MSHIVIALSSKGPCNLEMFNSFRHEKNGVAQSVLDGSVTFIFKFSKFLVFQTFLLLAMLDVGHNSLAFPVLW